jgi:hypothetical protein
MGAKWYCLKTPEGELLPETLEQSERDVMFNAYGYHANLDPSWGQKFWKKWPQSGTSLRHLGYKAVPVLIVEAPYGRR